MKCNHRGGKSKLKLKDMLNLMIMCPDSDKETVKTHEE